jgi:N4-gp56 family major capsid protein
MTTNTAGQFSSDIVAYIAEETLPLARRQLVAYQFGDPATLPEGRGTTYTASRYIRVPLPYAPLAEGVPPVGQSMTLQQVSATAQQWGDKITITDVAELTIYHPLFKTGLELLGLQVAETLDRNTYNNLNGGTQVNYVNQRGSRGALLSTDVLNTHEINRMVGAFATIGVPRFMGDEQTDEKVDAESGGARASDSPRKMPHYVTLIHPLVTEDMRENQTIITAWSYSDVNRLYNYELGEWGGCRFCMSNMIPTWTGYAASTATAGTAGSLATGTYKVIVTGSDTQNQYESYISQTQTGLSVTGSNGSITLTTPNVAGFTYNVYIGTGTAPANLGLSASGPTQGPMQGQAVQLPANTSVTITGIGLAQVAPAAPATGVTVYPTYVIGRGAYAQVTLKDVEWTFLKEADKSDPLNQLRVMGWKCFYGTLISNNQFFGRIESSSAFSATFG